MSSLANILREIDQQLLDIKNSKFDKDSKYKEIRKLITKKQNYTCHMAYQEFDDCMYDATNPKLPIKDRYRLYGKGCKWEYKEYLKCLRTVENECSELVGHASRRIVLDDNFRPNHQT